jgi:acyl-ACP thioesterase
MRIPESEYAYLSNEPRMDMPVTKRKLVVDGPWSAADPIHVTEQHLDTNRHVNNAQYVLMALDALGLDVTPHRICVQYQRQAQLGDVLAPRIHTHDGSWTVELTDADGQPYATVLLEA